MWVVYVCEFVCVNIYIYIYTITREKVTKMTMCFFFFVCSDYPSRVCSWPRVPPRAVVEYSSPVLRRTDCPQKSKGSSKFYLFFSFSSRKQKKKRGTRKKCIHTKLRARRVVFCKYARRREHGNASFTFNSNHDILLRIVKKQR